jgi:hypothetical protein
MAVLIKFIYVSVAGRRLRPIIANYNGDCRLQVQSLMQENMQDLAQAPEKPEEAAARPLSAAALRALAEAAERRKAAAAVALEKEIGGRGGPDPARYGDWEAKGIAHDF